MSIQEELLRLKGNKELLQAEKVVDWAQSHPDSELHGQFEWDDRKAGREFRIWQARRLISIHCVIEEGTRRLVSLTIDRPKPGGGYRDVNQVLQNRALTDIMLDDAFAELERVRLKYERLKALTPIWKTAASVRRKTKAKAARAAKAKAKARTTAKATKGGKRKAA